MSKKSNDDDLKNRIQQLERENARLHQIIKKTPIPLFVLDKNHTITHFNEALESLSGLSAKEMLGTKKQWKAFYGKKRPVMADLLIDQAPEEKIQARYGDKYQPDSGRGTGRYNALDFFPALGEKGRWLFFSAESIEDAEHGMIQGAVEILQDVTKEKNAEKNIRKMYRIYRDILDFIPYPVMVFNQEGLLSYCNPAFTGTFGWKKEDLLGKTIPFIPEGMESNTYEMIEQFSRNSTLTQFESRRLTRSGKTLDVQIWAASHSGLETGTAEHFFLMRDITEEKRLESHNKTIMRISAVLPEYPELEDLMNYISAEVKTLLGTQGALVLLYDEIKEELFSSGAAYDDSDTQQRAKAFRFPVKSVLAGKIIRTGEYALVNDMRKLQQEFPEHHELLGYKTRSLLEVPIKSEGRIIGVLCAINKKNNLFDYNDMELMSMIAATCAISIENARFSEAVREAYRNVAAMNRAKGKAINHLSHELKTPVAVLTGSLYTLKKKMLMMSGKSDDTTLERIERNLNRIVEIQEEVTDIMEDKTLSTQKLLLQMFESCQDELEILIHQNMGEDDFAHAVRQLINEKFGPRAMIHSKIAFSGFFNRLYKKLMQQFAHRKIQINIGVDKNLPELVMPEEILGKMLTGLIKNAVENTPDQGRIDISVLNEAQGILFIIQDFGVGIEKDDRAHIFEGFFSTQDELLYSTKSPYTFNAGGKGADLLRIKIFSDRLGLSLKMESRRCRFLKNNPEIPCPGNVDECQFCASGQDCIDSGHTIFSLFFPAPEKS